MREILRIVHFSGAVRFWIGQEGSTGLSVQFNPSGQLDYICAHTIDPRQASFPVVGGWVITRMVEEEEETE